MMAPMLVPAMATGRTPMASSVSSTGMWASPRTPPPPNASPIRFAFTPPIEHEDALKRKAPVLGRRHDGLWAVDFCKKALVDRTGFAPCWGTDGEPS